MANQGKTKRESVRVAVGLRAGRTAVGWNQEEFAQRLGVAKSTVARIETLESVASSLVLMRALQILREAGVELDLMAGDDLAIRVTAIAIDEAERRLDDEQLRRSDRKKR